MNRGMLFAGRLVALLGVVAAAACGMVLDQKQVSKAAQVDIVGQAEVVHEAEYGTQGATSLQVLLFVLDLGSPSAEEAVAEQGRRLEAAGWTVSEYAGRGVVAHSVRANAVADVSTLDAHLKEPHSVSLDDINAGLRSKFPDPGRLIVVSVEPRT